jgi:hypothetical protein
MAQDMAAFGSALAGRTFNSTAYAYGFDGMRKAYPINSDIKPAGVSHQF